MRGLALAALAMLAIGAVRVAPIPAGRMVRLDAQAVVTAAGLTVADATAPCPEPGDDADARCVAVRVTAPHRTPFVLAGVQGSLSRIGIGPLTRGGPAAVVLETFTGGAHCCEHYAIALPDGAGFRRIELARSEMTDQGPQRQTDFNYGLDAFPADIDGDGHADFTMGDDAFAYAFTDYADSWTPPVILDVVDGRIVDISRRPGFRAVFAADLAKAQHGCIAPDQGRSPNGACAAYAADAARLGRFASAWREVLAHYDRAQDGTDAYARCTAAYVADKCPAGHAVNYPDYPAALRAFLQRDGYLP